MTSLASQTAPTPVEGFVNEGRGGGALGRALGDLGRGLVRSELWLALGWHDIRRRYRRSTLGPFWLTLSMAGTITGIGLLYATLFGQDVSTYLPYLAYGLIIWGLISALTGDGCSTFIDASQTIEQVQAPLSTHIYQMLWRNVLIFAHNAVLIPIVMTIFQLWPGWAVLWALPGLVILIVTFCGVSLALGVLSARFRDIPLTISMIIQFGFFFTPIIWSAEQLPQRAIVVVVNPFYYMLEIVRAPLLGKVPPLDVWLVAIGLMLATWAIAIGLYAKFRGRIAYWI
ncbi:MAG: ABC transporter permease [Pseudomonadota bacterium]